jgi:hypothetical protein
MLIRDVARIGIALVVLGACNKVDKSIPLVDLDRRIDDLQVSSVPEEANNEVPTWAKLGIAQVKTVPAPEGVDHKALLYGGAGQEVGSIEITSRIDDELGGSWRVVSQVNGQRLQIDFSEMGGLRMTDLATGRAGLTRFDHEAKQFSPSPMLDTLRVEFADLIPVSMGTLSAIEVKRRDEQVDDVDQKKSSIQIESNCTIKQGVWRCNGEWYRDGWGWGTQSECCVIARYRVAEQCTNSSCIGCCEYRSCDSWCQLGTYACVCGISGRACGW